MDLNGLLRHAVELGASDIHLKIGKPPVLRRDGSLGEMEGAAPLDENALTVILNKVAEHAPDKLSHFHAVGDLAAYPAAVEGRIGPLTRAGWGAKAAFTRFPRTTFALARIPFTFRAIEKVLRGELTHPGAARGLERGAVRLIDAVAKAAAS